MRPSFSSSENELVAQTRMYFSMPLARHRMGQMPKMEGGSADEASAARQEATDSGCHGIPDALCIETGCKGRRDHASNSGYSSSV